MKAFTSRTRADRSSFSLLKLFQPRVTVYLFFSLRSVKIILYIWKKKNKKIRCYLSIICTANWTLDLDKIISLKTRKIGCYFIVIKIKEKRRCHFKNNISSYCRSSPSSGQDSNWLVLKVHSGINVLKGLVVCDTAQWNNDPYWVWSFPVLIIFTFQTPRKLAVNLSN